MNPLPQGADDLLAAPLASARRHASGGGRVIGVTSSDIPVELIVAAGAFPLALPYPPGPTPTADAYLEPTFSPFARALTEQWLCGEFDFLDAVVFPRSNDSLQRTYYYLCELQRRQRVRGPRPLLFDVAKIPRATSVAHTYAAAQRLSDELNSDLAALPDAIAIRNRRRGLMDALLARRLGPAPPSGALAERLVRAADRSDADEFDAALEHWLATAAPVTAGPRLLLAGSPPPDDRLHRAAEAAGACIVDEFGDHAGDRWGAPIPTTAPALEALARHHATLRTGSRSFENRAVALAERARVARADGVVLWIIEEDESLVWDVPAMKQALVRAQIPLLELTRRPWDEDASVLLRPFIQQLETAS